MREVLVALLLWFQAPATIPDLVWWVLGGAITLLNLLAVALARAVWQGLDDRLKRLERDVEDMKP